MAIFLDRQQLYRVLQRELPDGVYPDGAPSAFFSTADMDSVARTIESTYDNMERIYDNFFPQTADEKIDDWLRKMFQSPPSSLSLADKRAKVITKVRAQPKINLWEILRLVAGFLPVGKYVQIIEYCNPSQSGWLLDEAELGLSTILADPITFASLGVSAQNWCSFVAGLQWRIGEGQLGINTALAEDGLYLNVTNVQKQAFLYEVRIFDYTVTGADFQQMKEEITLAEPARSSHIIRQNLNLADFFLSTPVTNVDEFSLVNCITRDPLSSTGYSGLT